MASIYSVELNGDLIGHTQLENADPPMGVVRGKVEFSITEDIYSLFKRYCIEQQVAVNQDDEEFGFIDTQNIPVLKVYGDGDIEVTGESGASICGFSDDGFEITIVGVPYPFYGEEFPHHIEAYDSQFSR